MKGLRQVVTAASALLCGVVASGASFEKAPIELPGAIPVQLSLPFAAIPADALNALDPLAKAISAAPQAASAKVPAALEAVSKAFEPQIKASGDQKASAGELSSAGQAAYDGGSGGPELPYEPEFRAPSAIGTGGVVKAPVAHPYHSYSRAWEEAVYQAGRKGVARDGVRFREVTGNIPAPTQGAHLLFAFDAAGAGKTYRIYVDFAPEWAQVGDRLGLRAALYQVPGGELVSTAQETLPGPMMKALRASPETALRLAREKVPSLSSNVSFRLELQGSEPWYQIYDSRGGHVAVAARTGRVVTAAVPRQGGSARAYRAVKQALGAAVKRLKASRPSLTRADIEAAAAAAAQYKGRPWSQTEFEAHRAGVAYHLQTHGATKAQLKLFYELTDKAPVLNGGFNPWAGD